MIRLFCYLSKEKDSFRFISKRYVNAEHNVFIYLSLHSNEWMINTHIYRRKNFVVLEDGRTWNVC